MKNKIMVSVLLCFIMLGITNLNAQYRGGCGAYYKQAGLFQSAANCCSPCNTPNQSLTATYTSPNTLPCPNSCFTLTAAINALCSPVSLGSGFDDVTFTLKIFPYANFISSLTLPPAIPANFTLTVQIPAGATNMSCLKVFGPYTTCAGYNGILSPSDPIILQWKTTYGGLGASWNVPYSFPVVICLDPSMPLGSITAATFDTQISHVYNIPPWVGCETGFSSIAAPANCSLDPNTKYVYPVGCNVEKRISVNDMLTYTVQFENIGTADATQVIVTDVLDADLDLTTFKALGGSHVFNTLLQGNTAKFIFQDIKLTPSATLPATSKGWLVYQVKPKSTLPQNTQITNSASIVFDTNTPIVTNTTLNTILICNAPRTGLLSEQYNFYIEPNPATEFVNVNIDVGFGLQQLKITDIMGRIVKVISTAEINNKTSFELNVSTFDKGVYSITAINNQGVEIVQKIVIQ